MRDTMCPTALLQNECYTAGMSKHSRSILVLSSVLVCILVFSAATNAQVTGTITKFDLQVNHNSGKIYDPGDKISTETEAKVTNNTANDITVVLEVWIRKPAPDLSVLSKVTVEGVVHAFSTKDLGPVEPEYDVPDAPNHLDSYYTHALLRWKIDDDFSIHLDADSDNFEVDQ